jgi:mannosyltransferase
VIPAGLEAGRPPIGRAAELVALAAAMLIAVVLALPFLGDRGLYFDEVFSVTTAHDWAGMYRTFSLYENNMALYVVLLHGWMALAGDSEAAIRSLSLLCALLALPVVHLLALRLFDARVAVIADLLLATSGPFLEFAQEARSYSLLLLLSALAAWLFVEGLHRPRWTTWACYSVVAAASVYAHYFGVLSAVACFAAAAWPGRGPTPWSHLTAAGLGLVALLVPLAAVHPPDASQVDWIGRPGLKHLSACLTWFAGGSRMGAVAYLASAGAALWTAWRTLRRDPTPERWGRAWPHLLLIAWTLLPALAALAASLLIRPVFVPKYLLGSLPAVLLLVAAGVARLPDRWAVPLLVGMLLPFGYRYLIEGRGFNLVQDWRGVAAEVAVAARPGDVVVCHPFFCARSAGYYLARQPVPAVRLEPYEIASAPYHPGGGAAEPPPDLAGVARLAATHPRVWLLAYVAPDEGRAVAERRQSIVDALATAHHDRSVIRSGTVEAVLFSGPPAGAVPADAEPTTRRR